jgi:hypothetical protein
MHRSTASQSDAVSASMTPGVALRLGAPHQADADIGGRGEDEKAENGCCAHLFGACRCAIVGCHGVKRSSLALGATRRDASRRMLVSAAGTCDDHPAERDTAVGPPKSKNPSALGHSGCGKRRRIPARVIRERARRLTREAAVAAVGVLLILSACPRCRTRPGRWRSYRFRAAG